MHHGSCGLLTDLLLQSKPIPIAGLGLRKLGSSTSASPRAWLSTANETGVACRFCWTSTAQLAPRLLLPVGGDRILDLLQLRLTDRGADQSGISPTGNSAEAARTWLFMCCVSSRGAGKRASRSATSHNRMFVDAEVWLGAMEAPDSSRSAAGRGCWLSIQAVATTTSSNASATRCSERKYGEVPHGPLSTFRSGSLGGFGQNVSDARVAVPSQQWGAACWVCAAAALALSGWSRMPSSIGGGAGRGRRPRCGWLRLSWRGFA